MRTGLVSFVGAGPGAADLITLRGVRRLAEADVVVWAPSLIDPECVREHARPDAELVDSSRVGADEIVELFRRAARDKLKVARLHAGDPVLWGSVREQYEACRRIGVEVEIVPGVSQISAAASAVGRELTDGDDQSMILTKVDATALPDATQIREFAKHGATMGVFVAAARTGQLVEELTEGGYPEDTPVVVAYKTTWPDELLLNTTLGELEALVKQRKLWRHTLFLVGKAMSAGSKPRYRRTESADQVEDTAVPESGETSKSPRRTAWSARAGRTSRIAAARADDAPASEAAWRAVHGWQASAARSAVKPVAAAKPKKQDADQQSLEMAAPVSAAAITAPARTSVTVPEAKDTKETKTVRTATGQKKAAAKPRAKQAQRTRKSG